MGLAVMLEIPLLIVDIQRGRPFYRFAYQNRTDQICCRLIMGVMANAPCPSFPHPLRPIVLMRIYEAFRIAVNHMTPVIFLSDGYIANGAEPWRFSKSADLAAYQGEVQERPGRRRRSIPALSAR